MVRSDFRFLISLFLGFEGRVHQTIVAKDKKLSSVLIVKIMRVNVKIMRVKSRLCNVLCTNMLDTCCSFPLLLLTSPNYFQVELVRNTNKDSKN